MGMNRSRMPPEISVVLPTFDREPFLAEAIRSVRAQTFENWELLIVDDASNDGTATLVAGQSDPRVRYLRLAANRGVSTARNAGIEAARGRWIALLDSDDRWHPEKLLRQKAALDKDARFKLAHTDEIWLRRGRRVNPKKIHSKTGGWIYHWCLPMCRISPSSVLLHRDVLERVGPFDDSFPVCEDYEFWLRVTSRFPVLFLNDQLVVKQGGHPDQLSASRWGLDRWRVRALIKNFESGLPAQLSIWTAREIVRKARIVAQGGAKRDEPERALRYQRIARRFEDHLARCGEHQAVGADSLPAPL